MRKIEIKVDCVPSVVRAKVGTDILAVYFHANLFVSPVVSPIAVSIVILSYRGLPCVSQRKELDHLLLPKPWLLYRLNETTTQFHSAYRKRQKRVASSPPASSSPHWESRRRDFNALSYPGPQILKIHSRHCKM